MLVVMSSLSLVVNLMASPAVLGETRYTRDWVTVFLVIAGIGLSSECFVLKI